MLDERKQLKKQWVSPAEWPSATVNMVQLQMQKTAFKAFMTRTNNMAITEIKQSRLLPMQIYINYIQHNISYIFNCMADLTYILNLCFSDSFLLNNNNKKKKQSQAEDRTAL